METPHPVPPSPVPSAGEWPSSQAGQAALPLPVAPPRGEGTEEAYGWDLRGSGRWGEVEAGHLSPLSPFAPQADSPPAFCLQRCPGHVAALTFSPWSSLSSRIPKSGVLLVESPCHVVACTVKAGHLSPPHAVLPSTPARPPSSLLLCQQDRGWPVAASASSGPRPVRAGHLAWGWGWPKAPPTRSSCFSLTCSAKPPAPSHSAVSAVARSLPGVRVQNSQGLSTP